MSKELCRSCPAKFTFHNTVNKAMKTTMAHRLKAVLAEVETDFEHWQKYNKMKLMPTRRLQVERKFAKQIQSLKITIHLLTPFAHRKEDVPSMFMKKDDRATVDPLQTKVRFDLRS